MIIKSIALTVALGSMLTLAACSSDSKNTGTGGGDGKVTTSVDGSKDVAALSASEKEQYCKDVQAAAATTLSADEAKNLVCNLVGTFGAFGAKTNEEARPKCQSAYDQCLKNPPSSTTAGKPQTCDAMVKDLGECKALTVVELNACHSESNANLKVAAKATCNDLDVTKTSEAPKASSCDVVKQKCGGKIPGAGSTSVDG
jgi:hypothetical protein